MPVEAAAITPRARRRRRIVDHFCAGHAITPYDTIRYRPPAALAAEFEALLDARLIRQEGQGYFWLDLNALDAQAARHRRIMVPVSIAVTVVLALVVMLAFYRG